VEAVTPTGETVELAKVVEAPPATVASTEDVAMLPQTASWSPMIGLIGLLSLGAGFALWMFSKRNANRRTPVSSRAS
jgi:LPXTG-motif cell wall-anchored protein